MKRARINEAITSRAVHKKRRRKYSEQREEKEDGSVYSVDGDRGRRRRRRCVINSKNEAEKLLCKENGNRDKFSACMWDIPYILYISFSRSADERFTEREGDRVKQRRRRRRDDDVWGLSGCLSKRQLPVLCNNNNKGKDYLHFMQIWGTGKGVRPQHTSRCAAKLLLCLLISLFFPMRLKYAKIFTHFHAHSFLFPFATSFRSSK